MAISLAVAVSETRGGSGRIGRRPPAEHRFRLFGLTVASEFFLTPALLADPSIDHGPAGLSFSLSCDPLLEDPPPPPLYLTPLRDRDGASLGGLYRGFRGEILRFSRAGEFCLHSECIDGYLLDGESDLAELRFLGPVMSYWFERRGLPTLHASAVAVSGRAVAFLSRHGGGKSGLAAAMVQTGCPLLADDLVVLEEREESWEVRPAYPEMR